VKTASKTGKFTPLRKFWFLTQREHYSKSQLHYSQGWALCYWLMKGTRDKVYKEVPLKLYNALVEMSWRDAVTHALEGIDLDKMEKDFLKDLKRIM
ncbi:MAG: hypothetical protein ACYTGV_14990, partial [Planctomycetota bacterium]